MPQHTQHTQVLLQIPQEIQRLIQELEIVQRKGGWENWAPESEVVKSLEMNELEDRRIPYLLTVVIYVAITAFFSLLPVTATMATPVIP